MIYKYEDSKVNEKHKAKVKAKQKTYIYEYRKLDCRLNNYEKDSKIINCNIFHNINF